MNKALIYVLGAVLISAVVGAAFSYGLLVGKLSIYPYYELRQWWSDAPHSIKSFVSSTILTSSSSGTGGNNLVDTSLLVFRKSVHNSMGELELAGDGGALASLDSVVFGVDRNGQLFLYEKGGDVRKLGPSVNMNRASFVAHTSGLVEDGRVRRDILRYFRVLDLQIRELESGDHEFFISHHFWNAADSSKITRISNAKVAGLQDLITDDKEIEFPNWDVIFESSPGITFSEKNASMRSNHTGGRMAIDASGNLLIGLGEHKLDGLTYPEIAAQDESSSYGKIMRIDLGTRESTVFAMGIRNPQGLYIDRDGSVWETEHGPRGGDELNLIQEGSNYGWPYVTYGTEEGSHTWPHNPQQGRHDGYALPVYSWVPSVGISNLIQIDETPAEWDGDLLVSSLGGLSLFRVHVREERVVLAEPIHIGERIRDLEQLVDGTIVIFADNAKFVELRPVESETTAAMDDVVLTAAEESLGVGDVLEGCKTCHSLNQAGGASSAPSLWNVYNRPIASTDFPNYSSSLSRIEGNWDDANLKAFLLRPEEFASGTTMPDQGFTDGAQLDALISYFRRQKGEEVAP